jgi:hypothetical protein
MKNEKVKSKISLQDIGDFYFNLGYRGKKLHAILIKDKAYQELLKNKKGAIAKKMNLKSSDRVKYALSTEADLEILSQCNLLMKEKLFKNDKYLIKLIKSQLLDDWRTPLLKKLKSLAVKYLK